jgi:hypothetical protein
VLGVFGWVCVHITVGQHGEGGFFIV